ncbi:MAG: hypothetical protein U0667_08665 [Chloroflexota bacterium]
MARSTSSSRIRRGLLAAALLCLVPAEALAASPVASVEPSMPAHGTAVLLDPGAEPRTELRYRLGSGTFEMTVDSTQSISVEADGTSQSVDLPTTRFVVEMVIAPTSEAGVSRVDFRYLGAGLAEAGDAEMGVAIQDAFEPLLGLTGWMLMDATGKALDLGFEGTDELPPALAASISDFERLGTELSAPLPTEPVGIGARWRVLLEVPSQGLVMHQTVDYTLLERTDDAIVLAIDTDQTADPGPFSPASLPAGTTADLVALDGSGSGTMRLTLDGLVPTSTMSVELELLLTVDGMPATLGITADAEVRPGADPAWPSASEPVED